MQYNRRKGVLFTSFDGAVTVSLTCDGPFFSLVRVFYTLSALSHLISASAGSVGA